MEAMKQILQNTEEQEEFIKKNYFSEVTLAAILGNTPRTLKRWHQLRIGPPRTMIGRMIFYRRESVEKWLLAREQREVRKTRRRAA